VTGSTASSVRVEVNGRLVDVEADPATPLLYVLRNDLGLCGTRFGCGLGQCGSCTVLLDGRARTSCDLPVSDVADRRVTTIEGISVGDELHPVQVAIVEEGAGQCGYCLSGIVMTAVALLAEEPNADEARIRVALEANICRCGAHARIVRAVIRAARSMAATR
jgi:nicotinate dehydrogenase subunit A